MGEILVSVHEFTGNTVKNDTNDQDENNCDKFHIQYNVGYGCFIVLRARLGAPVCVCPRCFLCVRAYACGG